MNYFTTIKNDVARARFAAILKIHMGAIRGKYHQVFRAIVGLIPVDMMNVFSGKEQSSHQPFNHQAMFPNVMFSSERMFRGELLKVSTTFSNAALPIIMVRPTFLCLHFLRAFLAKVRLSDFSYRFRVMMLALVRLTHTLASFFRWAFPQPGKPHVQAMLRRFWDPQVYEAHSFPQMLSALLGKHLAPPSLTQMFSMFSGKYSRHIGSPGFNYTLIKRENKPNMIVKTPCAFNNKSIFTGGMQCQP